MKRKDKSSLNRRLLMIYVCYIVILVAAFLHSYVPAFTRGFSAGMDAAQEEIQLSQQGIEMRWYLFAVKPAVFDDAVRADTRYGNVAMEISPYDAFASVRVSTTDPDNDPTLQFIARNYRKTMLLSTCTSLSWLAILVLIGVIINSLRRSIRDQRTLPDSNIRYMRIIGVLIVVRELFQALSFTVGQRTVAAISAVEPSFAGAFPVEYGYIVLGVLVFFSAEVFAIVTLLSEEQKLTI